MKPIDYESSITDKSASTDDKRPKEIVPSKPKAVTGGQGDTGRRVAEPNRSISLVGGGDHSGRDEGNSMSLVEAYRDIVLPRREGESQLGREDVGKAKVCVSCGTSDPGSSLGFWAHTQQQKPICQKCARERAGV